MSVLCRRPWANWGSRRVTRDFDFVIPTPNDRLEQMVAARRV
jgi:hypothetical protein